MCSSFILASASRPSACQYSSGNRMVAVIWNHPEALTVGCLVRIEQTKPLRQGPFVFLSILLGDFSPVPRLMAPDELHGQQSGLCKGLQRAGRDNDMPQRECCLKRLGDRRDPAAMLRMPPHRKRHGRRVASKRAQRVPDGPIERVNQASKIRTTVLGHFHLAHHPALACRWHRGKLVAAKGALDLLQPYRIHDRATVDHDETDQPPWADEQPIPRKSISCAGMPELVHSHAKWRLHGQAPLPAYTFLTSRNENQRPVPLLTIT